MYITGKISYRLIKLGDLNWILERVSMAFPRPVARKKEAEVLYIPGPYYPPKE